MPTDTTTTEHSIEVITPLQDVYAIFDPRHHLWFPRSQATWSPDQPKLWVKEHDARRALKIASRSKIGLKIVVLRLSVHGVLETDQ